MMCIHKNRRRRGSAVVELAVCLPVIFTLVFASIEACNMIALKQILSEAAYDGALAALKPNADETTIVNNINTVLAARNVTPSSVLVEGEGGTAYATLIHGDSVVVTVAANTNGNIVGPQLFGFATSITSSATGIKQ